MDCSAYMAPQCRMRRAARPSSLSGGAHHPLICGAPEARTDNLQPIMNISVRRLIGAMLMCAGLLPAISIAADDVPANIKQVLNGNGCSGCHSKAQTVVGPAFDAIAAKYKNAPDVPDRLMHKVRAGGSGVWGEIPMPPNPGISDSDLHSVLGWILKH